ncbi:dual-specificity MAP kinase phosphatase Pmp1 [Schizosaccharomyces japonicus yFS275]|uniref:protein-tyrosine-phosphatase n=1 Tax=Schizosaccharomyces japonicus (strain yFS275 / FY16936) TaxID=402676 RepID=B6K3S2_SCHJY|nr:dual-specificity MAP kinase phosphatase Pmp1 [Schizosaccharomyces japonicus yFS275]EEB08129.1 dual-specificity MAP kinase phosphatase Pmp1 [Schizosaccharomyces japonicus yFS275]
MNLPRLAELERHEFVSSDDQMETSQDEKVSSPTTTTKENTPTSPMPWTFSGPLSPTGKRSVASSLLLSQNRRSLAARKLPKVRIQLCTAITNPGCNSIISSPTRSSLSPIESNSTAGRSAFLSNGLNGVPVSPAAETPFIRSLSGANRPYPNGPVCIYSSNVYLYAEPTLAIVQTFDVVLNVAKEVLSPFPTDGQVVRDERTHLDVRQFGNVKYVHVPWEHHSTFPQNFDRLIDFLVHHAVFLNRRVLIHCQLGVSRSACLVIAFVMRTLGLPLSEAYDYVKQRSPWIGPNLSLIFQLSEYQHNTLGGRPRYTNRCITSGVSSHCRSSSFHPPAVAATAATAAAIVATVPNSTSPSPSPPSSKSVAVVHDALPPIHPQSATFPLSSNPPLPELLLRPKTTPCIRYNYP